MGTCSYTLTQLCWLRSFDNYFVVSTTNEFRGGNEEVSHVTAVHIQVFKLRISLIKGYKVVVRASACLRGSTLTSLLGPPLCPSLPADLPIWLPEPLGVPHSRSSPRS